VYVLFYALQNSAPAIMKGTGKNIRKLRELRNFTQQYIAEHLEMTQGNYARIENEEIQISEPRLQKIAELLGCNAEFILQFDVEKVYDLGNTVSKSNDYGMHQYSISPQLKELYEGRINTLESLVAELKKELYELKLKAGNQVS